MDQLEPQQSQDSVPQSMGSTQILNKSFSPKFIGLVLTILILGGVAYAGLWWWNQKSKEAIVPTFTPRVFDETANWKMYRNDKYRFEFNYPPEWIKSESLPWEDLSKGTALEISQKSNNGEITDGASLFFYGADITGDETKKYITTDKEDLPFSYFGFSGRERIGNKPELSYGSWIEAYKVSPSGKVTLFTWYQSPNSDFTYQKYLLPILSTFKFIPSTSSGQVSSDWKTYQNNKYRYSIKYPSSWSIDTNNAYNNLGFGGFTYTMEGPLAISGNFSSGGTLFLKPNGKADETGRDVLTFQIVKPDPIIIIDDFVPHEVSLFKTSDKKENLIINGMPAVRYTSSNYTVGEDTNYSFGATYIKDKEKGIVYLFTYFRSDLASIISTVKILKPEDDFMCIQVITRAKDPNSGREVDFPTPCDIPEGWQKI